MDSAEVEEVLARAVAWAERRSDVEALALVGSTVTGPVRAGSDVDLVVLTGSTAAYVEADDWVIDLIPARLVRTCPWGVLTERRLALASGLEIDVGFADPSWATVRPVDDGTRRVVAGGMRILYDPRDLLADLAAACEAG